MAKRDPKQRTGSGMLAPATQRRKERPADTSNSNHHKSVMARASRGYGEGLVGTNHLPSGRPESNRTGRTASQSRGKGY